MCKTLGFPLEKFSRRKYPQASYPSFLVKPSAPQDVLYIYFFSHSTQSSIYVLLFIFITLSSGKNWNIVTGVKSYVTLHRDILSFTRSQPWRCLHHPTCLHVPPTAVKVDDHRIRQAPTSVRADDNNSNNKVVEMGVVGVEALMCPRHCAGCWGRVG